MHDRFINPRILASISNLQLAAKTVVDGFMFGSHQSPKIGTGLEFSQYRSYEPGDDLRRVDWKMYARSDRYYVREAEIESSITVRFILDASASMLHDDSGLTKFDFARLVVAALAWLAHSQGDAIGLDAVNNQHRRRLLPHRGQKHLHRFYHQLEQAAPIGIWPVELTNELHAANHRDIIVVVSDMHENSDEIEQALATLAALKNEVILFHVLGRNEIDFTYKGALTFEDLESGRSVHVDTDKIRQASVAKLQRRITSIRKKMHDQQISCELLAMDQPLELALRSFLTRRMKLS